MIIMIVIIHNVLRPWRYHIISISKIPNHIYIYTIYSQKYTFAYIDEGKERNRKGKKENSVGYNRMMEELYEFLNNTNTQPMVL